MKWINLIIGISFMIMGALLAIDFIPETFDIPLTFIALFFLFILVVQPKKKESEK